jgi:hypothetical protein
MKLSHAAPGCAVSNRTFQECDVDRLRGVPVVERDIKRVEEGYTPATLGVASSLMGHFGASFKYTRLPLARSHQINGS